MVCKRIGKGLYVDGGVVSNLPAWLFDEERQLDPEAINISFDIGAPVDAAPTPPSRLAWPGALLDTALFGSQMLSRRAVGLSELITFRPAIGMMDFDLSPQRTREELKNATNFALAEVDRRLFRYPETYERACESVVPPTEKFLEVSGVLAGPRVGRVRVGVALPPESFKNSLRIRFVANYEDDPDQQVLVPLEGSFIGHVWTSGRHQLFTKPFPRALDLQTANRRALRRYFWRDLA